MMMMENTFTCEVAYRTFTCLVRGTIVYSIDGGRDMTKNLDLRGEGEQSSVMMMGGGRGR